MSYDLIVVGAGVMGAFHAYHALKRGLRVLLLEKDAAPREATVRNFGQVVPSGMSAGIWQKRGLESTRLYKDLQSQFDLSVRANGSLYVASDDAELQLCAELHAINQTQGYDSVLLDQDEILRFQPALKKSYARGGLLFPQEITVEPRVMISRLLAYLVEQGLDYHALSPIVGCERSYGGVQVWDSLGNTHEAAQAIICNGREFKLLYPEVFFESAIEVVKLQMMLTQPLPQVKLPGSILTGLTIRRYESFQECPSWPPKRDRLDPKLGDWGIHILFKQATNGSIILGDSHQYAPAKGAEALGFDLHTEINDWMIFEAQKILELPVWDIATTWAGYYTQHKNGVFTAEVDENIHVATAIGGKGMTCSPAFARENLERILG